MEQRGIEDTAPMRETGHQAGEVGNQITDLAAELESLLPCDRYIRYSQTERVASALQSTEQDGATLTGSQRIDELETLATDPVRRDEANDALVEGQVPSIPAATRDLLPSGLTEEQVRAIATDGDVTLVLAGTGTGKTAVVIRKIAHLVRNQGVAPPSILALAFNRKADIEIRKRLPADLRGAHVSTFHSRACGALGYYLVGTVPQKIKRLLR